MGYPVICFPIFPISAQIYEDLLPLEPTAWGANGLSGRTDQRIVESSPMCDRMACLLVPGAPTAVGFRPKRRVGDATTDARFGWARFAPSIGNYIRSRVLVSGERPPWKKIPSPSGGEVLRQRQSVRLDNWQRVEAQQNEQGT